MASDNLDARVDRAVGRIEARLDRFEARVDRAVERIEAKLDRGFGRVDVRMEAEHRKTRECIDKYHRRTVLIVLGGLALATAILAIVIAVT